MPRVLENSLLGPWGKRAKEMIGDHLVEVLCCIIALADRMSTIRISEHREELVVLDQFVD